MSMCNKDHSKILLNYNSKINLLCTDTTVIGFSKQTDTVSKKWSLRWEYHEEEKQFKDWRKCTRDSLKLSLESGWNKHNLWFIHVFYWLVSFRKNWMQDRCLFSTQSCVLIHSDFGRVRDEKERVVSNTWQQTFLCVRYSNQKSDATMKCSSLF